MTRVVGEIRHDVAELGRIDRGEDSGLRRDREAAFGVCIGDRRDEVGDERSDVDRAARRLRLGTLPALEQDELVDERADDAALIVHRVEDAIAIGGVGETAAAQDRDETLHDRERRTELVARVGDELTHRCVRAVANGEGALHLLDGAVVGDGQDAEFVPRVGGDQLRSEVARRQTLRARR